MRKGEMINHPTSIIVKRCSPDNRLLNVDPFNDFLSEGGKLWSFEGNDTRCAIWSVYTDSRHCNFLEEVRGYYRGRRIIR
jgi:hypothetical protein